MDLRAKTVRIARELLAICTWFYILTKVFFFDIDRAVLVQFAPKYLWLLNYKAILLLVLFTGLIYSRKNSTITGTVFYVFFYPFIVICWKLPKILGLYWPLTIAFAPAVYGFASAFKFNLTLATAATVSAFVILFFNGTGVAVATTTISLCLVLFLWTTLKRAYSATIFSGLTKFVTKSHPHIRNGAMGNIFSRSSREAQHMPPTQIGNRSVPNIDNNLLIYISTWTLGFSADKIKEVSKKNFIDLYLGVSFLFNLAVMVFGFAYIYFGLYKVEPSAFDNAVAANYWSFAGYSFTTFTTASVSKISASSLTAQIISYFELFCFLLASFIFVITTFTSSREKYRRDLEDFVTELQTTLDIVSDRCNRELQLTFEELEHKMLNDNVRLVNSLRALSGKQPLEPPDTNSNVEGYHP